MSSAPEPYCFRRRTIGRAASPPTWACYEQIPYGDDDFSDSGSDFCSEDEEDYHEEVNTHSSGDIKATIVHRDNDSESASSDEMNMDMLEEGDAVMDKAPSESTKDIKGKQKAVDVEPEKLPSPRKRKQRTPTYTLRPILTIHRSQGFVWNQDLFVPPYIKDRYIASTSPPNAPGFISSSATSANSGYNDYEIEVVEIRVDESDLDCLMP